MCLRPGVMSDPPGAGLTAGCELSKKGAGKRARHSSPRPLSLTLDCHWRDTNVDYDNTCTGGSRLLSYGSYTSGGSIIKGIKNYKDEPRGGGRELVLLSSGALARDV